jgi:beta-galactosidase
VIRDAAPGRSLSRLAGVEVEEFGRLAALDGDGLFNMNNRDPGAPTGSIAPAESSLRRYFLRVGNQDYPAAHLYESVRPAPGVEVLGAWSSRFLAGLPAITSRAVGLGRVLYVGTYLTDGLVVALARLTFQSAGAEPLIPDAPEGVELTVRQKNGLSLMFALNTTHEQKVVGDVPAFDTLIGDGVCIDDAIQLPAYGCAILRLTGGEP